MRLAVAAVLVCGCAFAQRPEYVHWSIAPSSAAPGGKALLRIAGRIEPGWHLYSASSAGGIPTSFQIGPNAVVARHRLLEPPPKRAFDPNFGAETETYEGVVTFLLELELKKDAASGAVELPLSARFQTCTSTQCVPGKWSGAANLTVDPAAQEAAVPAGYVEPKAAPPTATAGGAAQPAGLSFLVVAFGFGLATIFTPCVFPMIPITMSYFLNKQGGVKQAVVFCLGIIVLFSGLGLAATAILGPFGIVQLGSNPWVNGFIAALFIAFGLSLLGAFEITIPSAILTRLNRSSEKGGFAGSLLMGLTFSLASFACVGPFVGTLLAASVSEGGARPLIGMVTFATGLALPFFLLALFPGFLKRMPKSGGWLARVKVVMGFVILAASLKYLANVDQVMHWGVVTDQRLTAAWVVLFAMPGLYLLGFLRLEGIKAEETMGLGRLLTGMAFLVFALSLLPGVLGAGPQQQSTLAWMKDDYRGALERARREGKLLLVNFTGYACTNCHWMEAHMLSRPEIAGVLKEFVLVELYTDGTDAASEENQKLELQQFKSIAVPLYAILDADGRVLAEFDHLTKDPQEYLAFLEKGKTAPSPPALAAAPASGGGQVGDLPHVAKLGGGEVQGLAGKVVVMNFWATWCVPCIQEIPSFNRLNKEYGPKGVVVLGVSMDEEGAAVVPPFLKKHPMEYTVALGSEALSQQYSLVPLPVTLVFDRAGKQVKRFQGFTKADELQTAVEKALTG